MGQSDRPERPMKAAFRARGRGWRGRGNLESEVARVGYPEDAPIYPAVGAVAGRFPRVTLMVRVWEPFPGVVTVKVTVSPGL